jgi:hypothetical protein
MPKLAFLDRQTGLPLFSVDFSCVAIVEPPMAGESQRRYNYSFSYRDT